MRHRTLTRARLDAQFRTVQVVVRDVAVIASTLTITGPGVGAVLAYAVVAVLMLSVSPLLALMVLLGVPVLAVLVGPSLLDLRAARQLGTHDELVTAGGAYARLWRSWYG